MHSFFISIIIGLGVAMPIGPINIEIMRRNLRNGWRYGVAIGVGATSADVTYLVLLLSGALTLLHQRLILQILSVIGALILLWFAWQALRLKPQAENDERPAASLLGSLRSGYLIALFSPFNFLFWLSLTSQIAVIAQGQHHALLLSGLGVVVGAMLWVMTLNGLVHWSRHRLSDRLVVFINRLGGVILIGFAGYGLVHGLYL